jgi:hypothetical protein
MDSNSEQSQIGNLDINHIFDTTADFGHGSRSIDIFGFSDYDKSVSTELSPTKSDLQNHLENNKELKSSKKKDKRIYKLSKKIQKLEVRVNLFPQELRKVCNLVRWKKNRVGANNKRT